MPIGNQYGALGATFQVVRAFQIMSMIAIIGMTANFISNIVSNNLTAPSELIGTLSVVSWKVPTLSRPYQTIHT
jgi:predicted transcriptional regulator